ncbi:hypothetical protein SS50377_21065 [Spironucleus salmonicida]|uniref:Uncharacterized protein n=1 Tax=Spironucleus salmonicida TaxID=348837 RepID=V6LGT6_9EUKA|nr:hypothetical protein SS50377_21065 [Spironucleus salmonicida]|eukprot:EST43722.1 hypothetical protein SS50377_16776 [Spironucleus salmonicida]
MDLSFTVQSLYATRAQRGDYIPTPSLKIIPSLYELSLTSLMPEFIKSNCQNLNAPDKIIADLVQRLPEDVLLSQVYTLNIDAFWKLRLTHHFGIKIVPQEPEMARLSYLRNVIETLASGQQYNGFPINDENPLLNASQLFGFEVTSLLLRLQPDQFNYSEILINFPNLEHLTLIFDDFILDPNQILEMNTNHPLHYNTSTDETYRGQNYLRTKTLGEIGKSVAVKDFNLEFLLSKELQASDSLSAYIQNRKQQFVQDKSAFPFHNMPDMVEMNQVAFQNDNYRAFPDPIFHSSVKNSKIGNQDIAQIATCFKSLNKLKTLKIYKSQLNSQQSDILCQGLRQFNLDNSANQICALSLPFNQISDSGVNFIAKLSLQAAGLKRPEIYELDLRGNMLTAAGASYLGLALGSQDCMLEVLKLSGNGIKSEGFILLANGILKQVVKFGMKRLRVLEISGCGIVFDENLLGVLVKLFEESGLECIEIFGNEFSEGIYEQIVVLQGSCQIKIDWKKEEEKKE